MLSSLRNYGLCVDQMEELGLDTLQITKALAAALAHCYWKPRVDMNDVEFVLAPGTEPRYISQPYFELAGQENLVIWMLDYNYVRDMSQDADGVVQAVQAFWRNDLYFPRPFTLE
jgi:hypothetical protein